MDGVVVGMHLPDHRLAEEARHFPEAAAERHKPLIVAGGAPVRREDRRRCEEPAMLEIPVSRSTAPETGLPGCVPGCRRKTICCWTGLRWSSVSAGPAEQPTGPRPICPGRALGRWRSAAGRSARHPRSVCRDVQGTGRMSGSGRRVRWLLPSGAELFPWTWQTTLVYLTTRPATRSQVRLIDDWG